ncbi:MAG: FAD:protein FMN transferase [Muribaculaceae bacterium]|nr:FAD:protein FMN transferase [Muribaculaceae bacterium]
MEKERIVLSRRYLAILVLAVAGVAILLVGKCGKPKLVYHSHKGVVWTTEYNITYKAAVDLGDSIDRVLQSVDTTASVYNAVSVVSRVNNGTSMQVNPMFVKLFEASKAINKLSEGAFDPTVMPLVNAWGFGYKSGNLPTTAQIDSILTFVGMDKVNLSGLNVVKNDERVQLDFSSIAKGMACDEIGAMLMRNGAESFLVEIGGEVAAYGVNEQGQPWNVSVDLPVDQTDKVEHMQAMTLVMDKGGVATSGNYRKFKIVDGKKVSHIVNPKTGQPEQSSLLSATIVAANCMTADAWATACMAMGTDRAKSLMQNCDTLGVMLISVDDSGNYVVWSNKRFTKSLK